MNFWTKIAIWIVWLALVLWWLTPEINTVKDQIQSHNEEIKRLVYE